MYHIDCPKNGTEDGEPIRAEVSPALNYEDITDYIRAWPEKLAHFVAERLCDDGMDDFAWELYEYICVADSDGPAFEKWRRS